MQMCMQEKGTQIRSLLPPCQTSTGLWSVNLQQVLPLIQHQISKMSLIVHLIVYLYIYLNISSIQEIFNHVLADIEFFIGKVGAALAQEDGKKKKKKKKGKSAIIYGKLQQCVLSDISIYIYKKVCRRVESDYRPCSVTLTAQFLENCT